MRRLTIALFAIAMILLVLSLVVWQAGPTKSLTLTVYVRSDNGQVTAGVGNPGLAYPSPSPDRMAVATAILILDMPKPSPLGNVLGSPVLYESSLQLAAVSPVPGVPELQQHEHAMLPTLVQQTCASRVNVPQGPVPALNQTAAHVAFSPLLARASVGCFVLFVCSWVFTLAIGLSLGLAEGLRSGLSVHSCPSCDFNLSATPEFTAEPDPDPTPVTGSRMYRQCPECGWKGRV